MNYLKVTNAGLIVEEDLTLIGSSTKREQTGKIGMFGSGWKYALAWLVRNEATPIIISGNRTIVIDHEVVLHRDTPVKVLTVNNVRTSLTTDMGPLWTAWMALREIVSNAIDEGDYSVTTVFDPTGFPVEDNKTSVYIPMVNDMEEVMLNFNSFFAFNRKATFENDYGRVFIKDTESIMAIYRKGIRCYNPNPRYDLTLLDFDFNDIPINEDRLTQDYNIERKVELMVKAGVPTAVMLALIQQGKYSWLPSQANDKIVTNLKELMKEGYTFTTEVVRKVKEADNSVGTELAIPTSWYITLQQDELVPSIFEVIAGSNENFIPTDAKDVSQLNYFLSQFNITLVIRTGICDTDVFVNNSVVFIKDSTTLTDKQLVGRILSKLPSSYWERQLNLSAA